MVLFIKKTYSKLKALNHERFTNKIEYTSTEACAVSSLPLYELEYQHLISLQFSLILLQVSISTVLSQNTSQVSIFHRKHLLHTLLK